MNYFLGLDLGSGSIGWAVIEKKTEYQLESLLWEVELYLSPLMNQTTSLKEKQYPSTSNARKNAQHEKLLTDTRCGVRFCAKR